MVGAAIAELLTQLLLGLGYTLGTNWGLYVWAADDPNLEALLMTVAKVTACALVTWLVLRRSRESWTSLGRATLLPVTTSLSFVLIVGGIVIFLSEIDNLM